MSGQKVKNFLKSFRETNGQGYGLKVEIFLKSFREIDK